MKNIGKYIIVIVLLMGFSVINLKIYDGYVEKQLLWYIFGFVIIFFSSKIKKKNIFKYIFPVYIIFNCLLLYLLFFGTEINGSKAWINLGFITFQPSEFMKIILIILLSIVSFNDEKFLLKSFILTLIPSVLTFLEPDTGNVIFYLVIFLSIILYKERNIRRYIIPVISLMILVIMFFLLYFIFPNNFADIFGTNFYYRMDRIVNLFNNSSYQLNMALINMGSSYYFGNESITSIPEAMTDFAFSLLVSLNGFIGAFIYLSINFYFNMLLFKELNRKKGVMKNIVFSFLIMKIAQESIHILMNIGLFPITGIPLPLISYGGTSLISYFIMICIINMDDSKAHNMDYKALVD